ncbi:polyphosphate--glucose phosphotransferase [Tessaracoccus sp. ZS01]|uniref:polyphosphate--glucose phosphotransferase n=1 Tax=Tessaracoccus sp. ZS01 TaxID=1906324 RepID=UPI00096D8F45|nr:ROK family protein [Tessaracoccus sp. ZS01]MCG6567417.1 ROK family protein [Tessaracoccus sp. ZS01]OMG56987.1 polyphosphate glucokinase [Tessaracoccus sp. ZS01]
MSIILGIDVGGSGIKGAPVDLAAGDFLTDRKRIPTPEKSTPKNVAAVIADIIEEFKDQIGDGPVGITIPAPVVHGRIPFIANLDQKWAGLQADQFLEDKLGRKITLVNDADAAGLAEVHFGAAKGHPGLVILTTLGTGIGTAIIYRGVLIPNAELGHIEMMGKDAETLAASSVKDKEGLSYQVWTEERLQPYYSRLEMLLSPDLFVVGGGVSRDWDKFGPQLNLTTEIIPAKLRNRAGIIGAAIAAQDAAENPDLLAKPH